MSTVIDYERTYLVGRGLLKFAGVKLRVGEALSPDQLRSIARPEGFLATGRIYPAPAGWTPPQAPEAVETPQQVPAAVPPTGAEMESEAQTFVETPATLNGGLSASPVPTFLPPVAAESAVQAPAPVPALPVDPNDPAAVAMAQARAEAAESSGQDDEEIPEDVILT